MSTSQAKPLWCDILLLGHMWANRFHRLLRSVVSNRTGCNIGTRKHKHTLPHFYWSDAPPYLGAPACTTFAPGGRDNGRCKLPTWRATDHNVSWVFTDAYALACMQQISTYSISVELPNLFNLQTSSEHVRTYAIPRALIDYKRKNAEPFHFCFTVVSLWNTCARHLCDITQLLKEVRQTTEHL
jgi:hypothetical protein